MIIEETQQEQLMRVWVDALRGREYMQGSGALCVGEAYCCLGVADIVCFNATFEDSLQDTCGIPDDQGSFAVLSPERARALGLDNPITEAESNFSDLLHDGQSIGTTDPTGNPIMRQSLLAGMNDRGVSFIDIANYIERMGWC